MWEIIAYGSGSSTWLSRCAIQEGVPVRVGRAPRSGWRIAWDERISREHADLELRGALLHVRKLVTATNPISVKGSTSEEEFVLKPGESFQIGRTQFEFFCTDADLAPEKTEDPISEFSFSSTELADVPFADPAAAVAMLDSLAAELAGLGINEMSHCVSRMLLQVVPEAEAAGMARRILRQGTEAASLDILGWDCRDSFSGTFRPSMRLLKEAVRRNESMLYIWGSDEATGDMFTVSGEMDWAICVPMKSIQSEGLCFYLSGRLSEGLSPIEQIELLKLHVRLIELIARNVDSFHRLAILEQQQSIISHFFSPAVLEAIVAGEAATKLEPREGDITVMFCDMRGFSQKVEKSNDRLLELLERVSQALGVMTRGIMTHEGAIADFQGDAALAFWGWPKALAEGPLPACRAALDILREFDRIGKTTGHPLFGFKVGIGIAYGNAVAGRIGTAEQSKVGVFGDTVNTASRMEGMTKQFGAPILIDAATAQLLREAKDAFPGRTRRLGQVRPKGKENKLELYQLLPSVDQRAITDEQIAQFESAIRRFSEGQWPSAKELFQRHRGTDGVCEMYLRYMDSHGNQPPNDWDGALAITSK